MWGNPTLFHREKSWENIFDGSADLKWWNIPWIINFKVWKWTPFPNYYVFTILPFGLSKTSFVFTKVVRPLVKFWRLNTIRIASFSDDDIGIDFWFEKSTSISKFVEDTLLKQKFQFGIQLNHFPGSVSPLTW